MHMPRLENPADSPQPHLNGRFAWTSSTLLLWSVETNLFSGRCQHFRITVIPMAYALLCLRFTCLVHGYKKPLRHRRKTRYWWLVKPYQTGTFTLQGAPSCAWRTNVLVHLDSLSVCSIGSSFRPFAYGLYRHLKPASIFAIIDTRELFISSIYYVIYCLKFCPANTISLFIFLSCF